MPKLIRQGKNAMRREEITDVDALLNHDGLRRMIVRHVEVLREHCANYPRMDKDRKVTITLSLKPVFNESAESYDKAVFSASVGSPSLPTTRVDFNCVVVNNQPFFNIEDPHDPMQFTFRDVDGEETADGRQQTADGSRGASAPLASAAVCRLRSAVFNQHTLTQKGQLSWT